MQAKRFCMAARLALFRLPLRRSARLCGHGHAYAQDGGGLDSNIR